jgi:hypothetical protein
LKAGSIRSEAGAKMSTHTVNDPIILIPWADQDHHDQFMEYLRTEAGADHVVAAAAPAVRPP